MLAAKYQLYTTQPALYSNANQIYFFGDSGCRDRLFLLDTGELVYGNYASNWPTPDRKDKLKLGVGVEHDELVIYKQFDSLAGLFSFTTIKQLVDRKHVLLKRRDRPLYEGSSSYYYDYIDVGRLFWDDEGVYIWS